MLLCMNVSVLQWGLFVAEGCYVKICSCVIPDPLSRGIIDYVDDLTN